MAQDAAHRQKLRQLNEIVDSQRHQLTSVSSCKISSIQGDADRIFSCSSHDSRAAVLDTCIIRKLAQCGAEQAGNLDKTSPEQWVSSFIGAYSLGGSNKINWMRFGKDVREDGLFTVTPGTTFLFGCYAGPADNKKPRAERKPRDRTTSAPLEVVSSVDVARLQEQHEDKAQVARIKVLMRTLKEHAQAADAAGRGARVNLFELILHPTSFSQTVENLFDLAFQIKEGCVSIQTCNGTAFVCPAKYATAQDYSSGVVKTQNIVKIDYKTYRALVKKWCKGCSGLLPDRDGRPGVNDEEPPTQRQRTS
ncbi:hypothetical protein AB1Y20_001104 [Prymnesium parvum]|uniref:Non-structural maintenance of chromosomes element 4 n=1 Tax=Prymnesium parvum TaxID=97485 RepID=A0AB34KAN2_PRYPA